MTNCSDYEFYFQSICGPDQSSPTATQSFGTTGCGQCVDLPYCTAAATDGTDEWIKSFTMGTFSNNSGNDGGYGDYVTSGSISAVTGSTYNVTIVPEWGGTLYDEYSRVWIDLNQNGTFETEELMYDQGTATQTNATGTIIIPQGALVGQTRLRVQLGLPKVQGKQRFPSYVEILHGEKVEDYCVNITSNAGLDALTDGTVSVFPESNERRSELCNHKPNDCIHSNC